MKEELHDLYRRALRADRAFQRELERVYGSDAGDARYRRDHDDAAVLQARAGFRAVMARYQAAMDQARKASMAEWRAELAKARSA